MLPTDIEEAHKMIEDLRKENADRRVKSKVYEEAFSDFNEEEQEYLLGLVRRTAEDPSDGAKGFRDLAFQMLKNDPEAFLDGLDIALPAVEKEAETKLNTPGDEEVTGMTPEQMQKILDDRDAKAAETASKAQEEAAVEEIFAEIEALGFPRGTEGFHGMLSMAQSQGAAGKEIDFKALAPKVAAVFDVELPKEEGAEEVVEEDGSGKVHASTADVSGAGGAPGEAPKDWIAEAKAAGIDPMTAARQRAEARLG